MTTILGNRGQLWTSTLSPHLQSPHLDFPENLEILFGFRFRNGKANQFPQIFFRICFCNVMVMLGTHKPQQQATLTKRNKIPEIFFRFRFRNSTGRKSQILGFLFIFACNYFCEDGNMEKKHTKIRKQKCHPRVGPHTQEAVNPCL